jgi:hypothetical protein
VNRERITELEQQIADLNLRLPAHSVTPAMLQHLEELEDELEEELRKWAQEEAEDRTTTHPDSQEP